MVEKERGMTYDMRQMSQTGIELGTLQWFGMPVNHYATRTPLQKQFCQTKSIFIYLLSHFFTYLSFSLVFFSGEIQASKNPSIT